MTTARWKIMRILFFAVMAAALLLPAGGLLAQIQTQSGDRIEAGDVKPDMAFFAAGELTVSAKSADDMFAAGGDISVNGAQADHMIMAGGDIIVADSAFHDLILAGGDVTLVSGTVTDDVIAAGGDLNIQRDFRIGGSAIIAGGNVTLEAPIAGELRAAGGRLRLLANVAGDAHLTGDEIVIGPNVRIGGDLRHRAQKIEIDPSATVAGQIIELEPPAGRNLAQWGVRAAAAAAVFALAFLIGVGILVVVIAAALPALMNSASGMIREKPLATLGIGFLIAAAAPVVIAILFATLFGIPLALLIAAIYAAAAPLAIAAFAYSIGMIGRGAKVKDAAAAPGMAARIVRSALAAAVLVVVGLIPILGQLVWLLAYIVGMGAVMTRGGKALAVKA